MNVSFTGADGRITTVDAVPGERLLDAAWRAGQPLEGTCGGAMACATCHVHVAPADFARLTPPAPEEEDMLDLVPGADRWSRLACQILLAPALGDLALSLPAASRNRQGR